MLEVYIVGVVAVLAGGCIQGCLGFGFGLVTVPALLLVLPPEQAVPLAMMLGFVNSVTVAASAHRHIRASIVLPLFIGALAGVPLGIFLLVHLSGPAFKVIAGAIMTLFAIALYRGWRRPLPNPRFAYYPVGFLCGIMNGSLSMSGPPAILFLANQDVPRDIFRANLVGFFVLVTLVGLAGFGLSGLLSLEIARISAILAASMLAGSLLGIYLSGRFSDRGFARITMICVGIMGAFLLVRNAFLL